MYDTIEEARQKLEQSIVLFDGLPVYIQGIGGGRNKVSLVFSRLPFTKSSGKMEDVPISNPSWDFKTMGQKLGYVNVLEDGRNSVVFTSRMPSRHSRQGLDQRTVVVKPLPDAVTRIEWGNLFQHEGLVNTIRGKYHTIDEAYNELTKHPNKNIAIAISRKLALKYDKVVPPTLIYRNEPIGYTEDGVRFKLAKHKAFMAEELVDMEGLKIA